MKGASCAFMVALVTAAALSMAFGVRPVHAAGTIYIRADGTIDPPTANITTFDGVTYMCVGNITSDADGVVVERDNIVLDGAGYTLQGAGADESRGVDVSGRTSVTVRNTHITNFHYGIYLCYSSNTSVSGNTITANSWMGIYLYSSANTSVSGNTITANSWAGIHLYYSSNTSISGNTITANSWTGIDLWGTSNTSISGNTIANNEDGIRLSHSPTNIVYHNNFADNARQAFINTAGDVNTWDDGYPSGGNYWSDYTGIDVKSGPSQNQPGSDGEGDAPYTVDDVNQDRYPLMKPYPWSAHDIGITRVDVSKTVVAEGYSVNVTVTMFNYGDYPETFDVTATANETVIHTVEVLTLPSRGSLTITFTWNTAGFVRGNYTFSAVAHPVPSEADTTDNTLDQRIFITLAGDVDGNRQVDIFDVVKMAGVYGVSKPDPRYDPNCDLDGDGDIDIFDLVLAAGSYGDSW
jgi:parallel beta-helix repeat protein